MTSPERNQPRSLALKGTLLADVKGDENITHLPAECGQDQGNVCGF